MDRTMDKNCEMYDFANEDGRWKVRLPARYMMAVMGSVGVGIVTGFKANVSVAIVTMVKHTGIRPNNTDRILDTSACAHNHEDPYAVTETKSVEDGSFVWDESLQGLILSFYFWGYILTQIPGGRISELLSARWVLNGSVIINAIACILTPVAARYHYLLFVALRFIQGLGGGVSYPAMNVLIAKWSPPAERNILSSICYSGIALGIVVFTGLSGILATNLGWASIFYVEGSLSLIWCVLWWILIEDSPEKQTILITQQEKDYISNSRGHIASQRTQKQSTIPWREVLRSKPFWSILVAHTCANFGWYMLLTELPTYMNTILKFSPDQSARYSAISYLCMWLFTIILGKILTMMVSKNWINITVSKKIAESIACVVPICCYIGVIYIECNSRMIVFLMILAVTSIAGSFNGFLTNHINIAPNFAGTLMAVTNTIATIPGFVVPIFVGRLTQGNHAIEGWRKLFLITIGMHAIDIAFCLVFGTSEVQPWNEKKNVNRESTKNSHSKYEIVPLTNINDRFQSSIKLSRDCKDS